MAETQSNSYHLISSVTCPWVQRAVIILSAKKVPFDVTYINLRDKPDWFLKISPHGKVPVLKVIDADGQETPLFESNAIGEYLEETAQPPLHPADPIKRARNRAWTDFLPTFTATINAVNYCPSNEDLPAALDAARVNLAKLETELASHTDGPYFNGPDLSLVDAAYGPFFQRHNLCDQDLQTGLLNEFPHVKAWSDALLANETITGAVADKFPEEFDANLQRRGAYAWEIRSARRAAGQAAE